MYAWQTGHSSSKVRYMLYLTSIKAQLQRLESFRRDSQYPFANNNKQMQWRRIRWIMIHALVAYYMISNGGHTVNDVTCNDWGFAIFPVIYFG